MSKNNPAEALEMQLTLPKDFDPAGVPIEGVCASEPPVAKEFFDPQHIKRRFQNPPVWQPEITDESRQVMASQIIAQRQAAGKVTQAAVLIPLMLQPTGLSILFTQRTDHLHDHAGQISFPGGRMDAGDDTPNHAALRESEEEIGLQAQNVEIIGHLPQYLTVSGYSVTPVVGLVKPQAVYPLDVFEVADIFEVPFDFLMNPANHQIRFWESAQGRRRFYAMPYENRFIWGATAGMLRNLYHLLKL